MNDLRFINNLNFYEALRIRIRRILDTKLSYRKVFLIIFSIAILILYVTPKFIFSGRSYSKGEEKHKKQNLIFVRLRPDIHQF